MRQLFYDVLSIVLQEATYLNKLKELLQNRLGFFTFASLLFWLKTIAVYYAEFELGVTGIYQHFLLLINPLATTLLFVSIGLYFSRGKKPYHVLMVTYFLLSLLLFGNVLYYREFADFLTLQVITGSLSSTGTNFSVGLTKSFLAMFEPIDILYWSDFLLLGFLIYSKRSPLELDTKKISTRYALLATAAGVGAMFANLGLAEIDRPQLLTRTFDRNYIVKYLGINFYQGYDAVQTIHNNRIRASADENDLDEVFEFVEKNHADPADEYFGIAEGRNVFTLVLESAQQFAMDFSYENEAGEEQVVTPYLNELYHDPATISFNNYFHQTRQGKSSDAEILSENSYYGLSEGAAAQLLGSTNTFHSAPRLLKAEKGYTSAAFHGNVGSFWNRNDMYRQFGYDYFFDAEYYELSDERAGEYGLKDKLFFHDSAQYIEQLPQPFYSKYLTLTNHFPYPLDEANHSIEAPDTGDRTVNNYFVTMRYMDESIEEFINWTKEAGLYDNSIFVLYGDHYGISNMRNPNLAELLGVEEWTAYDNSAMQRVPMMFHIPGYTDGGIHETYGGQLDYLPTLMHLLGIETDPYLFLGQDLLSPDHKDYVVLRNGQVITPEYTFIGEDIYDTVTGELLNDELTEEKVEELQEFYQEAVDVLGVSDQVMKMDLLRFYTPRTLEGLKERDYSYLEQLPHLQSLPNADTSLLKQREAAGLNSAAELYQTDAPELTTDPDDLP